MPKFILFLLKTGKRVRVPLNKKTFLHPTTGKRLKTSALLNQQQQFLNDRRYKNKLIRSDKKNLYGLKETLIPQQFGEEYLEKFGKFKSSNARLKEQLYLRFEEKQMVSLEHELQTRWDINRHRSGLSDTSVEIDGKVIRPEEYIHKDIEALSQPGARKLYKRKVNSVLSNLKRRKVK